MKRVTIFFLLMFASLFCAAQRDINITATSPYLVLGRGLIWGSTGAGGVNNNWIFNAIDPNEGVCVYLVNSDTGNSHSATATIFQTGDPTATTYQNNQGRWSALSTFGTFSGISASTQAVVSASTQGAARIAVVITGGTGTAVGNTADLFVVQTQSSAGCGPQQTRIGNVGGPDASGATMSGNPFVIAGLTNVGANTVTRYRTGQNGGFPQSGSSGGFGTTHSTSQHAPLDDTATGMWTPTVNTGVCGNGTMCDGFETNDVMYAHTINSFRAFVAQNSATNPGATTNLLHFWNTTGTGRWYSFKSAFIACTATCEIRVSKITANGSTCTNANVTNSPLESVSTTTLTTVATTCTTPPTAGNTLYDVFVSANTPYRLDLVGVMIRGSSGSAGIQFQNVSSVTGTVAVSVDWGED